MSPCTSDTAVASAFVIGVMAAEVSAVSVVVEVAVPLFTYKRGCDADVDAMCGVTSAALMVIAVNAANLVETPLAPTAVEPDSTTGVVYAGWSYARVLVAIFYFHASTRLPRAARVDSWGRPGKSIDGKGPEANHGAKRVTPRE